jgi:hypothetical protein
MSEIRCACRSIYAHDCWALRHHGHTGVSELTVTHEGGPCECSCHDDEQDDDDYFCPAVGSGKDPL